MFQSYFVIKFCFYRTHLFCLTLKLVKKKKKSKNDFSALNKISQYIMICI